MLTFTDLSVNVKEKKILNQISFSFELGKNYTILGQNGSWKSSLALAIMGHPNYQVTSGTLELDGENLLWLSPDQRAKRGIFLAFQHIPEIPWVKFFEFLKGIYDVTLEVPTTFLGFKTLIEPLLEELQLSKEFLWRDLNVGFSWGERRKLEILQIMLLKPKYIILDEIDSGLDVDALKTVAEHLAALRSPANTLIIITHRFSMLEVVPPDGVLIMKQWTIVRTGDSSLVEDVKLHGFA